MKAQKSEKKSSIIIKFIYGILVPLVVILIITGIVLNFCLRHEIETLQERNLKTETESAVRLIEEYFEKYFSIIETTATLPIVQEALLEVSQNQEPFKESPYYEEVVETLVEIQKLSPDAIQSLYIADFTTSQYLRWDGLTPELGWDITTRPYYSPIIEAESTILTSVFQNVAGITVVSVSTPVFSKEDGQIIGIVNIDLGIDSLIEAMNTIRVGTDGYVMLFDSTDKIVSAKDDTILLKQVDEAGFSKELVEKVTSNQNSNIKFTYDDVSYCSTIKRVDYLGDWCVLGVIPYTEYHEPIHAITKVVIACFVLCILILSILCMMVVRKIIQPLKKLSDIVGELAEGNLYVDCEMSGSDEIGHLAGGVRVLVNRLRTSMMYLSESYEKLQDLAYKDSLTGIGNRMAFNEKLKQYDEMEVISCVVADVNNLKLCNDKYGHSEGDKIITDAVECICAAFDEIGSCYRIGGDEFCVLIPECEETQVLERLKKVGDFVAEKNKSRQMPLSIAFGYAMREGMTESMEELFNRSDEMMYQIKSQMKKQQEKI